ncbi:purine-nucleoside phosphorylase, partial [bacterium]|nr:purine-nucleoside phosphorylase [bacterium]
MTGEGMTGDGITGRSARLSDLWRDRVQEAAAWLCERGFTGGTGLILGSGLGNFVDAVSGPRAVDYAAIPGWATTTVAE